MQIVKAEILWSRECNLSCSYCSMKRREGELNPLPLADWKKGILELKKLGCSFLAIYGAEPLKRFDDLPEFISYIKNQEMECTVITSGAVPLFHDKLKILYDAGLRSLTMSNDISSGNETSSKCKSNLAQQGLQYFKSLGPVNSLGYVVTLHRQNYQDLPDFIRSNTKQGIWTFFDLIHQDRKQSGSKVSDVSPSLLFEKEHVESLKSIIRTVISLKREYQLIHCSESYLKSLLGYSGDVCVWNCAIGEFEHMFPSWVTVDCDGIVFPCDDFCDRRSDMLVNVIDLHSRWQEFSIYWKRRVIQGCPGCAWNTHMDAHFIKSGKEPLGGYVHMEG